MTFRLSKVNVKSYGFGISVLKTVLVFFKITPDSLTINNKIVLNIILRTNWKFQNTNDHLPFDVTKRLKANKNGGTEMLEVLQMFLFLFKSKYRRKCNVLWFGLWGLIVFLGCVWSVAEAKCHDSASCGGNGVCKNETCVCYDGWQGPQCQFCGGKVR